MRHLLAAALFICGLWAGRADDWRQFRGALSGLATNANVPVTLENNVKWRTELPGRGLSSPVIVGDKVVVTCSSGSRQDRLHVICFDAQTGAKEWERQFWATGRTTCHDKTSVAAPTPASDGERVYAIFSCNDVVCLDLHGNLVWLRGLTRDYPNASNSLGMSSSPVVTDGVLVVQVENDSDESFAAGLDALTGVNRWKLARPKLANWTSPLLLKTSSGDALVALQSGKGVDAVEPATGEVVWSYADGASTIPSSALSGGFVYVPSHGITALEPGSSSAKPKQLWRSGQLRPGTASLLVVGDKIFALNDASVLSCGDTATGSRLWQLRLKGPFSATPVAARQHIFVVNENGLIQVIDTLGAEGQVIHEFDLKTVVLSTPSIGRDALYIRSDGYLWKFSKS